MTGHILRADGSSLPVRDGLTIGRQSGCDIVLDDHKASRRHAMLHVDAGVVEVEDLGSSNGTLLNGKPVTRRMLRDGDEVCIGTTVLRYVERAAAPAAAAPAAPADDDLDLFGDAAPAAPAPAAPAPTVAPAAPVPRAAVVPPAPPPPAPKPQPAAVVEFEDEVVELRKPAPSAPQTAQPKDPFAPGSGAPAAAGAGVQSKQRVLQFQKQAAGKGPLGDDVGQLAGGARWALYLLVGLVGLGLAWVAMNAVG